MLLETVIFIPPNRKASFSEMPTSVVIVGIVFFVLNLIFSKIDPSTRKMAVIIVKLQAYCGTSPAAALQFVEILDLGCFGHAPGDEQADDLYRGEFGAQDTLHGDEMRSGGHNVVDDGDHFGFGLE